MKCLITQQISSEDGDSRRRYQTMHLTTNIVSVKLCVCV